MRRGERESGGTLTPCTVAAEKPDCQRAAAAALIQFQFQFSASSERERERERDGEFVRNVSVHIWDGVHTKIRRKISLSASQANRS
jgi:hypothetical protein